MRLPEQLDKFLFNDLGARFEQSRHAMMVQRDAGPDEVRRYLGTYWPRSFAESFRLFELLFWNNEVRHALLDRESIDILCIGPGTGGEVFGLLHLLQYLDRPYIRVRCFVYEPNTHAEQALHAIAARFFPNLLIEELSAVPAAGYRQTFDAIQTVIGQTGLRCDIVLCSKCVNEMYSAEYNAGMNAYERLALVAEQVLQPEGVLAVIDICTRPDEQNLAPFVPQILNRELTTYEQRPGSLLRTIFPLSCAFHAHQCENNGECFTCMVTPVSYGGRDEYPSKSCARVLARRAFAGRILQGVQGVETYRIKEGAGNGCHAGRFVRDAGAIEAAPAFGPLM